MSTPKTRNDFEHLDIAGAEQVKESYRAALQEEPRAMIDDAIRAAARRAVSSAPTSIGKRWAARWTTPLAAAATVMLTSSVIFMAVRDRPEVAPPIAEMVVASDKPKIATSEAPKSVVAPPPVIESNATDPRAYVPTPIFAGNDQPRQLSQVKEKKSEKKSPAPETEGASATVRVQGNADRVAQTPSAIAAPLQKMAPAPAKQIVPPPEPSKIAASPPPVVPSTSARKVLNEAKAEPDVMSNLIAQNTMRKKQSDREATAALTAEATGKVALPAAAAPAPPPAADKMEKSPTSSLGTIPGAAEKSDKIESVEAWIKRMSELKRQDKTKELADEIARFRKRYPNLDLSKELTE